MAKGLPSGTVTFLFTDIEGSTRLVRDLGDAYSELLDQHHRLLRKVWTRHRGIEVLTEGDAFFVAFASAADALAATVDGQRALSQATWPIDSPLRVRMGLHVGYAKPVDDDYRALAVHQAARWSTRRTVARSWRRPTWSSCAAAPRSTSRTSATTASATSTSRSSCSR